MKFLFVHQNFPGQFLHLVRHLVRSGKHEVVFISEGNENVIGGVRRVIYRMPRTPSNQTHPGAREFDAGLTRAEAVAKAALTLRDLGFAPDIIIGHHGWGELLNMSDVFPSAPILGYFEFFYHTDKFDVGFDPEFPLTPDMPAKIRAKNAINLQALNNPGWGQTPTAFQHSTYPEWARSRIFLLREGVNLDQCCPDPLAAKKEFTIKGLSFSPKEQLITYVARDLEPYRGFHVFMRSLPRILKECPHARVVLVGGDGVSYGARLPHGTWRERMLSELHGRIPLDRVHFVGKVSYDDFRRMLQRSDAHVYLTYPFVASWSLREAMASGCAIVGSATAPVEEFLQDRKTALLTTFTDPDAIAESVVEILKNKRLAKTLRGAARAEAERTLSMQGYLSQYEAIIEQLAGKRLSAEETTAPARVKRKAIKAPLIVPPTKRPATKASTPVVAPKKAGRPKKTI
ncbi:glycosyltransferase family 4 protein [Acetobacter sp. DsW_063]|uniref:glycosyltransferase family 4 protein n=1 Tax=Acetobacter sp. DsW_063 TaxID=1514894 RepID=UPI000A3B126C|nr:glycosyltransferase family 4 protein [Acetobacter sp. DsW_063]